MRIGIQPITPASIDAVVDQYLGRCKSFERKWPEIVPRWMRLRSRPAFVLRHSGKYGGQWRIVRRGSCDAAMRTFERLAAQAKRGALALVYLEYSTIERRKDETTEGQFRGFVEVQVNEERKLEGFIVKG